MGQYFEWVDFDRHEAIAPWVWPNGQKLHESSYVGCEETDAALTMLAGDWAGDLVVFLGDYADFANETHPGRREVERRLRGINLDDFIYELKDICGRFDYTARHPEATYPAFLETGDGQAYTEEHYTGPYDVEVRHYRYVVNESRREYVDRARTAARYIDGATGRICRYDPFPELMCSVPGWLENPACEVAGMWLGDAIRPSDVHPGAGYTAVAQGYSYWAPPAVTATDEEIRRVISENDLDVGDGDILEKVARCLA